MLIKLKGFCTFFKSSFNSTIDLRGEVQTSPSISFPLFDMEKGGLCNAIANPVPASISGYSILNKLQNYNRDRTLVCQREHFRAFLVYFFLDRDHANDFIRLQGLGKLEHNNWQNADVPLLQVTKEIGYVFMQATH